MDHLITILAGGSSGAILTFLLRGWITERLKQSIKHEYDQKLENHKSELNLQIQKNQHKNSINQLRTSLFFDHQREAFSNILESMSKVQSDLFEFGGDDELGLIRGIPSSSYSEFCQRIGKSDLFINSEIRLILEGVRRALSSMVSYKNEHGDEVHRDPTKGHEEICFLYPRLVDVLKTEIGVISGGNSVTEVLAFRGVKLLNSCHFPDIGLPDKTLFKINNRDLSLDIMQKGLKNYEELKNRLSEFNAYLRNKGSVFSAMEIESRELIELMSQYPI